MSSSGDTCKIGVHQKIDIMSIGTSPVHCDVLRA